MSTRSPNSAEIKALRKYAGLTQEEFAAKLYATKQTVSAWESDRRNMSPLTWLFALHIFGIQEIKFGASN